MNNVAIIFPGQGSHFVGMGRDLYDKHDVARQLFNEANDVLGYDIAKICFEGGLLKLNSLENMFPGLFIVCVALYKVYSQKLGIVPRYIAGHSLGEYAALTCSGALNFTDALKIIHNRGVLAQEVADMDEGSMSIIDNVDIDAAEAECKNVSNNDEYVAISCYNSPSQIAISGHVDAVVQVEDQLMEKGAQISPILTAPPLHSPLMKSAAEEFKIELDKYNFNQFKYPVISNVDAMPYPDYKHISNKLKLQLTSPVQWLKTIDYLKQQGINTFIEMGPQEVLTAMLKTYDKSITAVSISNKAEWKNLK